CGSGDSKSLAIILEELANATPEELSKMGKNGRLYYEEQFERNALFARLESFFRATIDGQPLPESSFTSPESSIQS
ncbi:MAG: hypothetical protein WCE43_02795, partial [Burkholderiales bacterium]